MDYIKSVGISEGAKYIRTEVFIKEQQFKDEFDEVDEYATTFVFYYDGKPVGCSRVFYDEEDQRYKVGRFALLKEYRNKGLGSEMVSVTINEAKSMGAKEVYLHAQTRAVPFYEKNGFVSFGEIGYEEYCPHIWMKKEL